MHSLPSSTHICLALRHLLTFLPHFDALTHVVIRVSSAFIFQTFAEVCYSVFVNRSSFKSVLNLRKAYIFKSLLKVYYPSVFNESSKAFIFQKSAERHPAGQRPKIPSLSHYGSWASIDCLTIQITICSRLKMRLICT